MGVPKSNSSVIFSVTSQLPLKLSVSLISSKKCSIFQRYRVVCELGSCELDLQVASCIHQ